jgi:hypothetical protein
VALPPDEHARLIRDGCLTDRALACAVCGAPIAAGDLVHCNDGYDRVYGEFVLAAVDGMHEDNWPSAHQACAVGRAGARAAIPRAVALRDRDEAVRLVRLRAVGAAGVATAAVGALGAAYWGGVGAAALVFGAGAGLVLVGVGLAARAR